MSENNDKNSLDDLTRRMDQARVSSGYGTGPDQPPRDSGSEVSPSALSSGHSDETKKTPPQRKADAVHNHMVLAARVGPCKAARARINVTANYYDLNLPTRIEYLTFRLDWELEGKNRASMPVKKEKMAECFSKVYKEHRKHFPAKDSAIIYNGTDMIYTHTDFRFNLTHQYLEFVNTPAKEGKFRKPPQYGRMHITPLGKLTIPTVGIETEEERCALMQFVDCVISQEHRFDLTGRAARFVQHGHSLFKIPRTAQEKRLDVRPIGMGQEVWLGLHTAVKTECENLMLNADTSGSIFYAQHLNLIMFFAQVICGYTLDLSRVNKDSVTGNPEALRKLGQLLKGRKLIYCAPEADAAPKIKKFDGFTLVGAQDQTFIMKDNYNREHRTTVARYYVDRYNYRIEFPNLPCLKFIEKMSKQEVAIPLELCYTLDEPERFKGLLTDRQLDVFIKAVCQNPKEKKSRIQRLCAAGGDYLGESSVMKEWGVSIGRDMVEIENCPVLPLPHMEMNVPDERVPVHPETGEFSITKPGGEREEPIPVVERNGTRIVLAAVFLHESANRRNYGEDERRVNLMKDTLIRYGLNVDPTAGMFATGEFYIGYGKNMQVNTKWLNENFEQIKGHCANIAQKTGENVIPLMFYVFPIRLGPCYSAIKYLCDVVHGIPSQCTVRKVFDKLTGSCVTNTSAQNLFLKMAAKTGSLHFRLSTYQHKNLERVQNEADPTLVIGIDVSHPSKEERFEAVDKYNKMTGMTPAQANKNRGQHEKLPTARPTGTKIIETLNFYDCPRSVVSVVGTLDIKGGKYGVSSRVQRVGQEETVNMIEPFKERIKEFTESVGSLPKHVIIYRDGASDTQLKKIAYEELEAFERALESFNTSSKECTLTYITAVKRHHARFFRSDLDTMQGSADNRYNYWNCPPGTLIEQKVVSRNKFDFFLQSHYGNLGTASPTRYTVVRDDWNVSPSFIQTIVFAHCFGNARCPKPLSIPIPLHYAHLAARRAKLHFDWFKVFPSEEYARSREDLVREEYERIAVTPHDNLRGMRTLHYM